MPLLEQAGDAAIAAQSAEAIGVMRRMLRDTIDYTKQRQQFGQSISAFQVLQHRMVDMFMQIEMATSAVYLATLKLGAKPDERSRAASVAKVVVAQACRFVGQNAIQLHGGMGMTDALAVGHYFKRATVIEGEFGFHRLPCVPLCLGPSGRVAIAERPPCLHRVVPYLRSRYRTISKSLRS